MKEHKNKDSENADLLSILVGLFDTYFKLAKLEIKEESQKFAAKAKRQARYALLRILVGFKHSSNEKIQQLKEGIGKEKENLSEQITKRVRFTYLRSLVHLRKTLSSIYANFIFIGIVSVLALMILVFLCIGGVIAINEAFNSSYLGFFIMGGAMGVLLILLLVLGNPIKNQLSQVFEKMHWLQRQKKKKRK